MERVMERDWRILGGDCQLKRRGISRLQEGQKGRTVDNGLPINYQRGRS